MQFLGFIFLIMSLSFSFLRLSIPAAALLSIHLGHIFPYWALIIAGLLIVLNVDNLFKLVSTPIMREMWFIIGVLYLVKSFDWGWPSAMLFFYFEYCLLIIFSTLKYLESRVIEKRLNRNYTGL